MKRIKQYASSSSIMDIKISYGSETFEFNLFKELVVDENKINQEIQDQPSAYAFLSMLHKKLFRISKDKKAQMEKSFARAYMKYKSQTDSDTGRLYPKESAKEMATKNPEYNMAIKSYLVAEENFGIIEACVKSFEQRASLIQTLSANIRKTI